MLKNNIYFKAMNLYILNKCTENAYQKIYKIIDIKNIYILYNINRTASLRIEGNPPIIPFKICHCYTKINLMVI